MSWDVVNKNLFMGKQGAFCILQSGWDGVNCGLGKPFHVQDSKLVLITRGRGGSLDHFSWHLHGCLCPVSCPSPLSYLFKPPCSSYWNSSSITTWSLVPTLPPVWLGLFPHLLQDSPYQRASDGPRFIKWHPTHIVLFFFIMMIFLLKT